jgi:DNA (cytosine-5)-methyltransferase 1
MKSSINQLSIFLSEEPPASPSALQDLEAEWLTTGVFSSKTGEQSDFATLLNAFSECGYSCAWRVLDSQWFGVPQRRRRVFVVGHIGNDWRPPFAVLFERQSLRGNPAPCKKEKQSIAGTINASASRSRGAGTDPGMITASENGPSRSYNIVAGTVQAKSKNDNGDPVNLITGSWWDGGQTAQTLDAVLQKGQTMPEKNRFPAVIQSMAFIANDNGQDASNISPTLRSGNHAESHANGGVVPGVLYSIVPANSGNDYRAKEADKTQTLTTNGNFAGNQGGDVLLTGSMVRRLTPLECERLQGFPDGYTAIPGAKDGPRYKALGNSMTTNVMAWIGARIDKVDKVFHK